MCAVHSRSGCAIVEDSTTTRLCTAHTTHSLCMCVGALQHLVRRMYALSPHTTHLPNQGCSAADTVAVVVA
jgi:hypothetical protein